MCVYCRITFCKLLIVQVKALISKTNNDPPTGIVFFFLILN